MLNLVLQTKSQEFFNYIASLSHNDLTVVCPNPKLSDIARNRFDALGCKANVLTISKFMQNELLCFFEEEELANYKGKSELILLLAGIWKQVGQSDYIQFKKAFNLLTELRSFSLSEQVLEEVLEHYDEELKQGVFWLYRFIQQLNIVDEHRSYFMLSERLREGDLDPAYPRERQIIFYGFDHLTASQVDLLKSMALRDDLYLSFYKSAYESSRSFDWINWFDEHNLTVIDKAEEKNDKKELVCYQFPRNYLGSYLKQLDNKESSFLIGTKNITREMAQELPITNLRRKVAVDLFESDFEMIRNEVTLFFETENSETTQVISYLKEQVQLYAKEVAYKKVKVCLLFISKLEEWQNLSEANEVLQDFDLRILFETVQLDLPRLNLTQLDQSARRQLYSLQDLEHIKSEQIMLCLSSSHGKIKGIEASYSENVEKYLTSIGPIRRADLDVQILKSKLQEFLTDNDVSLFIENGILDHDIVVGQLLENYDLAYSELEQGLSHEKTYLEKERIHHPIQSLSATKLQRFMECPKKYYYSYTEKLGPQIEFEDAFTVLELGQIEHKVIEEFFKVQSSFDAAIHMGIVKRFFAIYADKREISHARDYFVEIISYTENAIKFLCELKSAMSLEFKFEEKFFQERDHMTLNGSIDLLAYNDKFNFILDFKRSNSSFTTLGSVLNFEQIQLWFYQNRLFQNRKIKETQDKAIAYIDLSALENSVFFTSSESLAHALNDLDFSFKIKNVENYLDLEQEYAELEATTITKLMSEKEFMAKPRDTKACLFCHLKNICSRGINA